MAANNNNSIPKAYAGEEPYIFVSYAHKDSGRVFPFISALQKSGYNVWFDDGIRFGKEWEDEIAKKLLGCTVFLFMVSGRSLESSNCKDELHFARKRGKNFVNIFVEDIPDIPDWFDLRYMRYQSCNLFSYDSSEEAVEALSRKVGEMALARSFCDSQETKDLSKADKRVQTSSDDISQPTPKAESDKHIRAIKKQDFKKGSVVEFGSYPQTSNGEEKPIEWQVLENDGRKAMLVSMYALDVRPYNTTATNVNWQTCSLRTWLNGTFINSAFSLEEQNAISMTVVTADENPRYPTLPGRNTWDKIFLLSIDEVNKFFRSNDERKCVPTDYAVSQGANTSRFYIAQGKSVCNWWLRTPGSSSIAAATVGIGGFVDNFGSVVDTSNCGKVCVRPAMWIDLES